MINRMPPLARSFIWKTLERFSVVGTQLIIQLVLARLLEPEHYGVVAVASAIIAILSIPFQSGLVKALVQFKAVDFEHFSTGFYANLAASVALYLILYLCSPGLAELLGIPQLVAILRVLGVLLIIGVFASIQDAYLVRHLRYKDIFKGYFSATVISGAAAVVAATRGLGYWSLVLQQVCFWTISTATLWILSDYRPILSVSARKLVDMFRYSWNMMLSALIDTAYFNMQSIAMGQMFGTRNLGLVSKGQQFPLLITSNLDSVIQSVMLRDLSIRQENIEDVRSIVKKVEVACAYLLLPVLGVMIANADLIVVVLLGERWITSSEYLVFFTLAYAFVPFSSLNKQVPGALGRSDIALRNEIIKKIFGIIALVISLPLGLTVFLYTLIGYGIICFFIDAATTGKLVRYSITQQLLDICPYLGLTLVVCMIASPLHMLGFSKFLSLMLNTAVAGILYFGVSRVTKMKGYVTFKGLLGGAR